MHRMLSSDYPKILSALEETYGLGAFIYVGSSFQCLFPRHSQKIYKITTELICDMCIFPKNKPAILITVGKDTKLISHLNRYNLQMKSVLEEWIRETLVEFKALSGVVTPDDFQISGNFNRIISHTEKQSPTKVLPLTLGTMILTMETFLQKLATCRFIQRFYGVSTETIYLDQELFEELIELMEEKNTKTVYSKYSDYTMLLACELGYRLALIGHTSIHSKSEEKREFEQLRKAHNVSISISYDRGIAAENLEEGDMLLSSWKEGVILFRAESAEIAAARRALASGVLKRSVQDVQDEESRKKLMDLACLHIRRAEEQLENALRHADSTHPKSVLESFNMYSRDEMQFYPVETDAVCMSPTPESRSFKDRTVQGDLDSESYISESSTLIDTAEAGMCGEYPLGHLGHMAPSQITEKDETTSITSAGLDRPTISHPGDTLHNINTVDWSARKRVKDQSHLFTWLGRTETNIERNKLGNMSYISTEELLPYRKEPSCRNINSPADSEGPHQRKQPFVKQNKKLTPQQRCTQSATDASEERLSPSHQLRDGASTSYIPNQDTPTGDTSTNASEERPSPFYLHREPTNTSYIPNQDTPTEDKSTNASEERPSPFYHHREPTNTSYISNQDTPTGDTSTNASEERPSPFYLHREPTNTSYIPNQDTSTKDKSTNASEERPSPFYHHREPTNTSYIPNQDTLTRDKSIPKHNRSAGNESHIKPKRGQPFHTFVGESHPTDQGEPKPMEDNTMNSPRLDALIAIPKGVVKRRSVAFE
ncbi:uncharacterized protein [Haliotis asinina]|uniref:uncharacterized protein n=1 Tax=Haliotis asinina TaxID=109174 RepID=UPI0035324DDE